MSGSRLGSAISRGSLADAASKLEEIVDSGRPFDTVGGDLLSVAAAITAQPALRRPLTDPSRSAAAKADLVRSVLGGRIGDDALSVVEAAVRGRWSATRDLAEALDHLGVVAEVAAAQAAGTLDDLEDELFRFDRTVTGNPDLRQTLSSRSIPQDHKVSLVRGLLAGRATASTIRLVEHALSRRGGMTFSHSLEHYQKIAAARRDRLVALVRVATPMDDAVTERLEQALARQYGKELHLNVIVDPELIGGIRVELGDEIIDGTVVSRLEEARRRLAG